MSGTVVITDIDIPSGGAEQRLLEEAGLAVRLVGSRDAEAIVVAAADADALLVQWAPITAAVLAGLPRLRVISRLGIGYDMVDVEAATARGVAVCNTPDYCIEEVALHTLALALACARGIVPLDVAVRAGSFAPVAGFPGARRASATTVGIVGYGRIGRLVTAGARGLGMQVLVHDPFVAFDEDGVETVSFADLLAAADIVSLHAPLTAATRHLLDATAFARMRRGAYLVNTCRGGLVDEAALADAIASGAIAGAALDVFETEPLPADSRLRGLPGVILTPHAAWYSPEALVDLPVLAARNIVEFLAGRPPGAIVNPGYAAARTP
jgi:D-3-phosphoglycerate dehydrogenase